MGKQGAAVRERHGTWRRDAVALLRGGVATTCAGRIQSTDGVSRWRRRGEAGIFFSHAALSWRLYFFRCGGNAGEGLPQWVAWSRRGGHQMPGGTIGR